MTATEAKTRAIEWWTYFILIGGHWVVVSLLINGALRLRRAEQWVAWLESKPGGARFLRWIRGWGVDPVRTIETGAGVIAAKAAATQAGRLSSGFFGDAPPEGSGSGGAPGTLPPPPDTGPPTPPTPRDPSATAPPPITDPRRRL